MLLIVCVSSPCAAARTRAVGLQPTSIWSRAAPPSDCRSRRFNFELDQLGAITHLITNGKAKCLDGAGGGRSDGVFHLHRFQNHDQLILEDHLAGLDQHVEDIAGQRSLLRFGVTG